MSNSNLLDTKTLSYNDIIGNGKIYQVPLYQRDYSWTLDNWEDLWNDIIYIYENNDSHYMGTIVLQNKGNSIFQIIDGQQRFTTLSIIALSVISKLKSLASDGIEKEENDERVDLLMKDYLGQKDSVSLKYSSKLLLNENNNGFYQQRLLNFREPINYNKLIDSEKLLWDAYDFFRKKIDNIYSKFNNGNLLADFLKNYIGKKLLFIQITVEDELNAYTVFETLNSRGVELTSADLLKNYLFSLVSQSETDLNQVREQWKKIISIIGLKRFPTFLRHFLNSNTSLISKEYLFKAVKKRVKSGDDVFNLLDNLEESAYIYVALGNPNDDYWKEDKELIDAIDALKLFGVTQQKPLLMSAYTKLNSQDFKKLTKSIVNISYRYSVIGRLQTNIMDKVYNKASIKISHNEISSINQILNEIKELYVSDDDFKNSFSTKEFNTNNSKNKKQARYTLYKLESQLAQGNTYNYLTDMGTIEHILPEHFTEAWKENFSEDEYANNLYKLGNLTILENIKNREIKDLIFNEKLPVYQTSQYMMTGNISANEWNVQTIKNRQLQLANIACGIWQVQF